MVILRRADRQRLIGFVVADVLIADVPFEVSRKPPGKTAFGDSQFERVRGDEIRQNRNPVALTCVFVVVVSGVERQASEYLEDLLRAEPNGPTRGTPSYA